MIVIMNPPYGQPTLAPPQGQPVPIIMNQQQPVTLPSPEKFGTNSYELYFL